MSRTTLINAIIGEYRLVARLGEGGMGEVYRAVHSKIGRPAAVKVLSQAAHGPEFIERFLNEARIQASLQHSNIVTLYDFLEYNGQPCIIMEYIEGQTLTECIREECGLALPDALRIFQALADALDYIHRQGIIHRDIKSNNIKITPSGQVKLLDFGIAKSGSSPALTVTGAFIGTLQYLSPEQMQGGVADARSDIWALGVLLYEMTTGHLPFDATTLGDFYQKISKANYVQPSVINPGVPREIERIISRCLKKNPSDRYQSAAELLHDVNRFNSNAQLPATQVKRATVVPRPAEYASRIAAATEVMSRGGKNKPLIVASSALAVLLAVATGGYFLLGGDPPPAKGNNNSSRQSGAQQAAPPRPDTGRLQTGKFIVDVSEGRAEVYKGGERVGTTPYQVEARAGEQLDLTLKREGYLDKPVQMSVTENKKTYTFTMQRKE
ncbi:MAG TPA: protein kinase [Blastocatellia bacterium]|nr:protein kinase [Blastocatellia bacterium]